ncbi:helix-turn-helix domain-containing protein, partial [Bradyrhizobium sp. NBAIM08]|uniref:helix-turn-helix domain-containing protein n=1 Tax=Bradyrhizobium sp. NBAIM08 TaxID=2793815 RepID=UPI001CD2ADF4
MPTEVPKKSRLTAAARREVIEHAAAEVFPERGYHGAGVGEIAARAGVTVPVLYDHFASKRALYVRLIALHYEQLAGIWARHS